MANKSIQLKDSDNNNLYPTFGWNLILNETNQYDNPRDTWFKIDSTFTLNRRSLILVIYSFGSGAPLGVAVASASATGIFQANSEISVSDQGHTIRHLAIVDNGTYTLWIKNNSQISRGNISVYKLAEV